MGGWGVWHINPDILRGIKGGSLNQNLEPNSKLNMIKLLMSKSLVSSTLPSTCKVLSKTLIGTMYIAMKTKYLIYFRIFC